jgi:A/G-specific adenine glycosylase
MDIGATFCRPRAPRCDDCPARRWCRAAIAGTAEDGTADGPADAPAARGHRAETRGSRRPAAPFESTSRWLRGRILDALRDAPADAWVRINAPFGEHDGASIERALAGLGREGLAERHTVDPVLARLPVA